jgi:hypothetical protein
LLQGILSSAVRKRKKREITSKTNKKEEKKNRERKKKSVQKLRIQSTDILLELGIRIVLGVFVVFPANLGHVGRRRPILLHMLLPCIPKELCGARAFLTRQWGEID